jgi:membrane protease YdiL (CAAX protease family)
MERRRGAELLLLGLLLPGAVALGGAWLFGLVIPLLLVACLMICLALRRDASFPWADLWRWRGWGSAMPGMLLRFGVGGVGLTLVAWWLLPEQFLRLPRERPGLWLILLAGYPVLSVWPQELLFRAVFVHRYGALLGRGWVLILANAVVFAAWHLLFGNWVAPLLTALGSPLFLNTYLRTRSVPAACIEHALWGGLLFTLGYGVFLRGASTAIVAPGT